MRKDEEDLSIQTITQGQCMVLTSGPVYSRVIFENSGTLTNRKEGIQTDVSGCIRIGYLPNLCIFRLSVYALMRNAKCGMR